MASTAAPPPTTTTPNTDLTNQSHAQSRLTKTTSHLKYLYDPAHGPQPSSLRTRSLLRNARYIAIFLFWRIFRYAKYAATGALVAAVAGTAFGSVISGAAFVIAPTGILGGAGVGLLWATAKFGWRRAKARIDRRGGGGGKGEGNAREDERADAEGEEDVKPLRVPRTEPW